MGNNINLVLVYPDASFGRMLLAEIKEQLQPDSAVLLPSLKEASNHLRCNDGNALVVSADVMKEGYFFLRTLKSQKPIIAKVELVAESDHEPYIHEGYVATAIYDPKAIAAEVKRQAGINNSKMGTNPTSKIFFTNKGLFEVLIVESDRINAKYLSDLLLDNIDCIAVNVVDSVEKMVQNYPLIRPDMVIGCSRYDNGEMGISALKTALVNADRHATKILYCEQKKVLSYLLDARTHGFKVINETQDNLLVKTINDEIAKSAASQRQR